MKNSISSYDILNLNSGQKLLSIFSWDWILLHDLHALNMIPLFIFFIQLKNMTLGNNHNTIYGYRTSHVHKVFCLSVSNTKIPFGIYI